MQCATAAFVTVLVYDWLLTMRLEVEFIWRQKMSFGKLLYFINRYLVIIDLVILLNSYANPIIHGSKVPAAPNSLLDNDALCPSCRCVPWFHIDSWLGVVSIVAIDTIMLIRTWAMWHRSKKALAALVTLQVLCNLAEAGATLWASLTLFYIPSPNDIRPCLTGFARPNVLYALFMGVVVWDLVVMVATLIRVIPTMRLNQRVSPMIELILKDGIQYFILMLLIALANIVVLNEAPVQFICLSLVAMHLLAVNQGALATMLLTLQRVTNSVIGSRIMLNLRGMLLNPSYNSQASDTLVGGSSTIELAFRRNRSVYSNQLGLAK
ncbi:hypothetical protein MSAN_02287000 [Mycena sanguinolenta]|uniref:DUF6533 domain-containing protein n=1 Tax=Mycena sanguinolenta TaxID=230812 RepID=A0A8H6X8S7_9AGAR|nr:hypothetical protein MSAN_02287000 [Mycena sanguinolenta]